MTGASRNKIVFYDVGYYNLLICYISSLFYETLVWRYQNHHVKRILHRTKLVNLEEEITNDECLKLKTEIVETWINIAAHPDFPQNNEYRIEDLKISFIDKAWKDFGVIFDQHEFVRKIKQLKKHENWNFVDHFDHLLLRKYYRVDFDHSLLPGVRAIGVLNDWCGFVKTQTFRFFASLLQCLYLFKMLLSGSDKHLKAKIIWEAINPQELSVPLENSNALWVLNNSNFSSDEIIFLNPGKRFFLKEPASGAVHFYYSIFHLIGAMPFSVRLKAFAFSVKKVLVSVVYLISPMRLDIVCREQELICWKLVANQLDLRTYVNSVSDSLVARHQVLLLNQLGINTVFYLYSANSLFVTFKERFKAKHLSYSKILHNRIVVWHKKYKDVLLDNYDNSLNIDVLGPLMPAKEYFASADVGPLRQTYLGLSDKKYTYLCVYDVAPQMGGWNNGTTIFYPNIYNSDFCSQFLTDIDRLFHEMEDLVIVYKPKRNIFTKQFPLPEKMRTILEKNAGHPRWINLINSINPWIPILIADINICIPFTSTFIAAAGKGKNFILHNPDETAKYHEYSEINDFISTNYDQLKHKVMELKAGHSLGDITKTKFYEPQPSEGYTQAFVNYLRKL